eukprot:1161345-Pelagomonas_calceolata.AAC.16
MGNGNKSGGACAQLRSDKGQDLTRSMQPHFPRTGQNDAASQHSKTFFCLQHKLHSSLLQSSKRHLCMILPGVGEQKSGKGSIIISHFWITLVRMPKPDHRIKGFKGVNIAQLSKGEDVDELTRLASTDGFLLPTVARQAWLQSTGPMPGSESFKTRFEEPP